MIFHTKQHLKKYKLDINIGGVPIEQVESFEYLGLTIQENLQWNEHIDKISKKINRMSGVMHRIGNTVDATTLKSIYYAHVQSHISYLSPVWGNSTTSLLLNAVQVVQNNAIRSIFRHEYYSSGLNTDQIRAKYKILNVRQVFKYETAMLAYKIQNKIIKINIESESVGNRHGYSTRNAYQLYHANYRTNVGKFLIARLIAVEFNLLPEELRNQPSLERFKYKLKSHILS